MPLYFDESKIDRAGFVFGAWVLADEPELSAAAAALVRAGLVPGQDEYKSGRWIAGDKKLIALRDELFDVLGQCAIGGVLLHTNQLPQLGSLALRAAERLVEHGHVPPDVELVLDEGIRYGRGGKAAAIRAVPRLSGALFRPEQCSVAEVGIQLADLAAFGLAQLLVQRCLENPKMVPDPEFGGDTALHFELFTQLRWSLFKTHDTGGRDIDSLSVDELCTVDASTGVLVTPEVPEPVRGVAVDFFEALWMGCTH